MITLVHYQLQTSGVELEINLASNLPRVLADPEQIKQVLLNLLHNAMQAMPNGGCLRIETGERQHQENPGTFISITDLGEGIPADQLDRIFEPFFTTRPVGVGTGLGLSVSYGIITAHHGTIDVELQAGMGSRFTVWLPMGEAQAGSVIAEHEFHPESLPGEDVILDEQVKQANSQPDFAGGGYA